MNDSPASTSRAHRIDALLESARAGLKDSRGEALEACRRYLLAIANGAVRGDLAVKVSPSDLVQETLAAAAQKFDQFRGSSEAELLRWLTKILSYRIAGAARKWQGRAVGIEVSLEKVADDIQKSIVTEDGTPSALVLAEEEEERLTRALAKLDEVERQVVYWRNWERETFDEIARRLERSESGVRKIWFQAIARLKELLE